MQATILNKEFEAVGIIDLYQSFIWADRHDEEGDFEIQLKLGDSIPGNLQEGYYLVRADTEHVMIIESFGITSDEETGSYLLVSGRSLESIPRRRVVWKKTKLEGTLQDGLRKLFNENVIAPEIEARKIPNFIFEDSTDEYITSLELVNEYHGEELYEIVSTLCKEHEIGFKVTLSGNNFIFKLYRGADRSYNQTTNPYVIFSPRYDNVVNTQYIESYKNYKNITLVGGETDEETEKQETVQVGDVGKTGLDRREIYTDASDVSSTTVNDLGESEDMSYERYQALLRQKGYDTLIENVYVKALTGELVPNGNYIYQKDYFIGDVVQVENEFGHYGLAYVSEVVASCDESGSYIYPTFKSKEEGVYDT